MALKTPEQWLETASPQKTEGIFKLFLGYAPGVGKTYNMLSEAIRYYFPSLSPDFLCSACARGGVN